MGTFLEIATPLIQRGIPVIPVQPNEKRCLLPEWQMKATTDIEQVKLWQTENPTFNVGCVGKPKLTSNRNAKAHSFGSQRLPNGVLSSRLWISLRQDANDFRSGVAECLF